MHLVPNRTQLLFIDLIVDSDAVSRNKGAIPCMLYLVSLNSDILQTIA